MYRTNDENARQRLMEEWRDWTFKDAGNAEERRLRKIISAAYLRLARLDDSNPEVCHARKQLENAINGGIADWP